MCNFLQQFHSSEMRIFLYPDLGHIICFSPSTHAFAGNRQKRYTLYWDCVSLIGLNCVCLQKLFFVLFSFPLAGQVDKKKLLQNKTETSFLLAIQFSHFIDIIDKNLTPNSWETFFCLTVFSFPLHNWIERNDYFRIPRPGYVNRMGDKYR